MQQPSPSFFTKRLQSTGRASHACTTCEWPRGDPRALGQLDLQRRLPERQVVSTNQGCVLVWVKDIRFKVSLKKDAGKRFQRLPWSSRRDFSAARGPAPEAYARVGGICFNVTRGRQKPTSGCKAPASCCAMPCLLTAYPCNLCHTGFGEGGLCICSTAPQGLTRTWWYATTNQRIPKVNESTEDRREYVHMRAAALAGN